MKYILLLTVILFSCNNTTKTGNSAGTSGKSNDIQQSAKMAKQINLTILLDLSDRIDPIKNPDKPEHYERDSALIMYFTDYFLKQMNDKGPYASKGKMRIIFHPNPPDPDINSAAKKLSIDLTKLDTKDKKVIYENLRQTVAGNISSIYNKTITQAKWPGSDIWRFFKNDVKDITVDRDPNYRNLLVIFTDGYIYHNDSKDKEQNRYAFILPELLDKYQLRNNNNWSERIDKLDFGLISRRSDLDQLEVIVAEVQPSPKHRDDEDIIRRIMDKWFSEMKVKRWKIFNSGLPEQTKQTIENFLTE